ERYLQLPSSLFPILPPGEEETDWYTSTLGKWRREARLAQTFADFSEIRSAARVALGPFTYDDNGQPVPGFKHPELPFWIERLDEIANQETLETLRRLAVSL